MTVTGLLGSRTFIENLLRRLKVKGNSGWKFTGTFHWVRHKTNSGPKELKRVNVAKGLFMYVPSVWTVHTAGLQQENYEASIISEQLEKHTLGWTTSVPTWVKGYKDWSCDFEKWDWIFSESTSRTNLVKWTFTKPLQKVLLLLLRALMFTIFSESAPWLSVVLKQIKKSKLRAKPKGKKQSALSAAPQTFPPDPDPPDLINRWSCGSGLKRSCNRLRSSQSWMCRYMNLLTTPVCVMYNINH